MNQLLKLIRNGGLKDAGVMLKWAAAMSMQFMPGSEKNLKAQRNRSAWEEEREDILERANWLCEQVMVAPEIIGENQRHYRLGEFALVGEATALAMRTQINRYKD